MSPAELRNLNLAHLQKVLDRTVEMQERTRIETLIDEERAKPDSAYPSDATFRGAPPTRSKPEG